MSWSGLSNNQMVSFNDVQTSSFTLKSGQSVSNSNQCMTKLDALTKYNLNSASMSTYTDLQLVPKSVWNFSDNFCVIDPGWVKINTTHTTYRDGTIIPQVTDNSTWGNLTTGAWCYYDNNSANEATYGKLYNWYAVAGIHNTASITDVGLRKTFAPLGYLVPTHDDWVTLVNCLGGESVAAPKMKETGTTHWQSPNNATNTSEFTGLPGAFRTDAEYGGGFSGLLGSTAYWWSSSEYSASESYLAFMAGTTNSTQVNVHLKKGCGMSVRTIIDYSSEAWSCVINTGWTTINATHTTYRDGTTIPQVTSTASFSNLTTGAWCYYSNNSANGDIYGKLYNWYAVAGIYDTNSLNNPTLRKEFAPTNYRVPSNTDWNNLFTCLGGSTIAGGKMKETGTTHWSSPNTDATNSSGFTALPGGYLGIAGNGTYGFNSIQGSGDWWSLTDSSISTAYFCYLNYVSGVATLSSFSKSSGMSVRLVQS